MRMTTNGLLIASVTSQGEVEFHAPQVEHWEAEGYYRIQRCVLYSILRGWADINRGGFHSSEDVTKQD